MTDDLIERVVQVPDGVGLHARPAALLVQAAAATGKRVSIGRPDSEPVDARSILAVLSLDVRGGERIVLRTDGDDEVLATLERVIAGAESSGG